MAGKAKTKRTVVSASNRAELNRMVRYKQAVTPGAKPVGQAEARHDKDNPAGGIRFEQKFTEPVNKGVADSNTRVLSEFRKMRR